MLRFETLGHHLLIGEIGLFQAGGTQYTSCEHEYAPRAITVLSKCSKFLPLKGPEIDAS